MKCVSKISPLYELYTVIDEQFAEYSKYLDGIDCENPYAEDKLDKGLELILHNNGCSLTDDAKARYIKLKYTENYYIVFVVGAKGNEVNEFFDYIEFHGIKHLVVFWDFFVDIYKDPAPVIGRSNYFEAIKKITDVFIATTSPATEVIRILATTAAANMYRFSSTFLAAAFLDKYFGITEDDVSLIKYEDLRNMLDNIELKNLLDGIKYLE